MKKTQNIFKKFICLILTSILTFGSYVFPVFAAIPDNESPDAQAVIDAYELLKTHKSNIETEISTITSGTPSQAKSDAVLEAEEFIAEIDNVFYDDKLEVKTTQFNVVSVTIDFNDTTNDLGLGLEASPLKTQVLNDAYKVIQSYALTADYVVEYLKFEEAYTEKINLAGKKIDALESYVESLLVLNPNYDNTLYNSYITTLGELLISTGTQEDMDKADLLSTNLDEYYENVSTELKTELSTRYTSLKENLALETRFDVTSLETEVSTAIEALGNGSLTLMELTEKYMNLFTQYNMLSSDYQRENPDTSYITNGLGFVKEQIKSISEQKITIEEIELIGSMINQSMPPHITLENLVSSIDENELFDKLVSGELSYDVLEAYVNLYNSFNVIPEVIGATEGDINNPNNNITPESRDELNKALADGITEGIFGETGYYMDLLENQIKNESKTDEERLEILNKLDLVEHSFEMLSGAPFITQFFPSNEALDEAVERISEAIEKAKEFYNKSCDNTLSNLKANDIELDLTQESHKIYVGNDVTKLDLSYLKNHEKATVEVVNPEELKVGSNEVIIRVTAENGEVREYVLEVIRAEKEVAATTTENNTKEEVKATQMSTNNYSDETIDNTVEEETEEEKSNTSDSNEKYNEELEEEKGLNGLTVLLIVVGIALVGFGVYKIFGEKEDKKIERAFSNPQPKKQQTSSKKKNNKRK